MALANPYRQYRQTKIGTADRTQLIILLYDGAIIYLKRAKNKLSEQELEEKGNLLFKAQDVILELMGGLDMNIGDVAESLVSLYNYMLRRINEANIKNDPKAIDEIIALLIGLRRTWAEAILNLKTENGKGATATYRPVSTRGSVRAREKHV